MFNFCNFFMGWGHRGVWAPSPDNCNKVTYQGNAFSECLSLGIHTMKEGFLHR